MNKTEQVYSLRKLATNDKQENRNNNWENNSYLSFLNQACHFKSA